MASKKPKGRSAGSGKRSAQSPKQVLCAYVIHEKESMCVCMRMWMLARAYARVSPLLRIRAGAEICKEAKSSGCTIKGVGDVCVRCP